MPKNVVCKKCNNLVNDWCEKVIDSPDQDMQRDCRYFCEKTNADRIRAMSDEELAIWLCGLFSANTCVTHCPGYDFCYDPYGKSNGLKKWLQKPAEEDDDE